MNPRARREFCAPASLSLQPEACAMRCRIGSPKGSPRGSPEGSPNGYAAIGAEAARQPRRSIPFAQLSPDGTHQTMSMPKIRSLRNQLVLALCVLVSIVGVVQGISSWQLAKAGMSALLDLRLEQVATRLYHSGLADALPTTPARGSQPRSEEHTS